MAYTSRHYLPVRTGNTTITIGDLLSSEGDNVPIVDGTLFGSAAAFVEGPPLNFEHTSESGVAVSFKAAGAAEPSNLDVADAGLVIRFRSESGAFLKVIGMRHRAVADVAALRKAVLERYSRGELEARVHVVRAVVVATRFLLQYGRDADGEIGMKYEGQVANGIRAEADVQLKWSRNVGFGIDAPEGGVLGYQVSAIRLRRHLRGDLGPALLGARPEASVLAQLPTAKRRELVDSDALDLVDVTSELASVA